MDSNSSETNAKPHLPLYLHQNMTIMFVPLNPAPKSVEKGHYFSSMSSSRRSSFWYQIHKAGFTKELLGEERADTIFFGDPKNRVGIVDLMIDRVTSVPKNLTKAEIKRGRARLSSEIHKYKPRLVAFVGMGTYRHFRRWGITHPVNYGRQREKSGRSELYVTAFPSTSSNLTVDERIHILKNLHRLKSRYEKVTN